jgi:MATE family multidrug resistance protein
MSALAALQSSQPVSDKPQRGVQAVTGASLRGVARIAVPLTLSQLALAAITLTSAAFLGRASGNALAGAGFANSIVQILMAVPIGVLASIEPRIANASARAGRGDLWQLFAAAARLAALMSMAVAFAVLFASLLLPAGVAPSVRRESTDFFIGRIGSIPGWMFFLATQQTLNAVGRVWTGVVVGWSVVALNVIVSAMLIFGDEAVTRGVMPPLGVPPLGALGAGFASAIENGLLAVLSMGALWIAVGRGARTAARPAPQLRELLGSGLAPGVLALAELALLSVLSWTALALGAHVAAAHEILLSICAPVIVIVAGVAEAGSILVARSLGADDARAAGRYARLAGTSAVFIAAAAAIAVIVGRRALGALFTGDSVVLVHLAGALPAAALYLITDALQQVALATLRGAGRLKIGAGLGILAHWAVTFPSALIGVRVFHSGLAGVWMGLACGSAALAIAGWSTVWRTRALVAPLENSVTTRDLRNG